MTIREHLIKWLSEGAKPHEAIPSAELRAVTERMDTLEQAFQAQEQAHNEALRQIEERLGTGQRRAPSGRPFSVLRKIAEQGEAARRPNAS